jgi:transposase, IS30 family
MIKHHSKLKPYERGKIAHLKAKGMSLRNIAKYLGRSVSTISDELKRNSNWEKNGLVYEAISAQEEYEKYLRICKEKEAKYGIKIKRIKPLKLDL